MNNQRWLSQNFFTFFFTWGVFLPYWTGWLVEAKGLSVPEASTIMGLGLIARAASTMFAFPFASKFLSNKKLVSLLTLGAFITTILYIPATTFAMLSVITILFSALYPALLPAIESSAGTLVQQGSIHYGKSRSYGSIGFVIAVLIISMFTAIFGEQAILWSMIVGLIGMLIMQLFPAPSVLLVAPTAEERKSSLSMGTLLRIKGFPIVLLVVILLQGAHASYYNYGYIYLQDLQVNPFYIGMIINVAVIFEIIYFLKADSFLTKWRPSSLLILAGIGSTLRWILIYLFPNVWVFIISQALHALSFGVAHYAFIRYITKTLPKQQIPNAQGVYSALGMSLSVAFLTFIGGFLYEITPGFAFIGMTVCTVPAVILIFTTRKKFQY